MLRITAYADRLDQDLDAVQWSEGIKKLQRDWIGRSVGAEVDFFIGPATEYSKWFEQRQTAAIGVEPSIESLAARPAALQPRIEHRAAVPVLQVDREAALAVDQFEHHAIGVEPGLAVGSDQVEDARVIGAHAQRQFARYAAFYQADAVVDRPLFARA